jgi:hypothetical protein
VASTCDLGETDQRTLGRRLPRYAWLDVEGTVYEARQLGPGSGEYKGYALEAEQRPRGLAT